MNNLITDTIGIDTAIQFVQEKLYTSLEQRWLGKSIDGYGRVHIVDDKPRWFNTSTGDYDDVYVNDRVDAHFAFMANQLSETEDGYAYTNEVKLLVFCNLKTLFNDGEGRQDERAKRDVVESLRILQRLGKLKIDAVQSGVENVLQGLDFKDIMHDDMQPFLIFSVNFELYYNLKDKCN